MFASLETCHGATSGRSGTSGWVSIPHTQSADRDPEASPRWRVVLVDDDEWTRQLWRDVLESYPDIAVVGEARDGREAVSIATAQQPDVILMDIALPHLDGIQATHRIRKACPRTIIIGMSGHYAPPVYTAMRTAGAAAFVCKNQVLAIHDMILHILGCSPDNG